MQKKNTNEKGERERKSCVLFPFDLVGVRHHIHYTFIYLDIYLHGFYLYFSVECDIGITHLNPVSSMPDLMVSHFLISL